MPRFAANLSMMFTEWPFLDRFAAAADAGFTAVEYLFPYEHSPDQVGSALNRAGLTQALFNLPPGDWAAGERGMAAFSARAGELAAAVETALPYAEATSCSTLHLMAGIADRADPAADAAYRAAVIRTAERLGRAGITLVLEPINKRDMPGYFLNDFGYAAALIGELGLPNLRLQFDLYHRQILHGDVVMGLRQMMPIIGHVQIAGVPDRHEPDESELDFHYVTAELDRLGYTGFIGCEYRPVGKTTDGLGWFAPYRASSAR
ncbi:MAG TPA: 2-oxo-tetronate isomerase [Acidisoma sp.]|jgi:hydroxypyruvate isomerase|nr:2-oxo-tetronate isomerase [Acidisoma sp.]